MYKYSCTIYINEQPRYEDLIFGIKLKSGTEFNFMNCNCLFKRGNKGHIEEYLHITYYRDEKNLDIANLEIDQALKSLSYIFGIPLDGTRMIKENYDDNKIIEYQINNKKLKIIDFVSNKILKLKNSKKLFNHNIRLLNIAQRYNLMEGFNEEAYLNYFKVIENIVSYDFEMGSKNKKIININKNELKNIVEKVLEKNLGIRYSEDRLNDMTNKIKNTLESTATNGIFFHISWFCKNKKIKIDEKQLQEAIKLRNKIAHGEYVEIENYRQIYGFIMNLSYEVVAKNFFNKRYKDIAIERYIGV